VNGSESDVVFNYPAFAPKVEDVVSNALTHLYIVLTNFLPPVFVSSSAFYELGGAQLVAYQHGYHASSTYLVPMHYLFLWRYAAGAAAVLFGYALCRAIRALWHQVTTDTIALTVFLVMTAVGGPTHMFVKIRPMKTVPLLAYHAPVGILGVSLLISYLLMRARRDINNQTASAAVLAGAWCVMGYATLARPAMLDHLAAQVGLLEGQYPDPMGAVQQKLGIDITTPKGAILYQLQPVGSIETDIGLATEGPRWLPELHLRLDDLSRWAPAAGNVHAVPDRDAIAVRGDASQFGYQIRSPSLAVPPHADVTVRMRLRVERGRVCTGVLDEAGQRWVLAPTSFRQEYHFQSGAYGRVAIVIANCNRRVTENERSVFRLFGATYEVAGW
jgi:hypothetical protein